MAKTLQRLFFASITKHTGPVKYGMQVPPPHIPPGIEVKTVTPKDLKLLWTQPDLQTFQRP